MPSRTEKALPEAFRAGVAALALASAHASAAPWQLSAGPTLEEGSAVEIARRSAAWEIAVGVVSEQEVRVNYLTPVCPYAGAPPSGCRVDEKHAQEPVEAYAYLSLQRRFEFRRGRTVRPQAGLGLVAQSDTNEYVSSRVNLSLSLGLALGSRLALEWRHFSNADTEGPNLGQDALLLRWALE